MCLDNIIRGNNMRNYAIFVNGIHERDVECSNHICDSEIKKSGVSPIISNKIFFEEIYSAYLQRITLFALGYVGNIPDAQNIAHDVFAAFWKKIENVDRNRAVPYLYEATKNTCLNNLRKKNNSNKFSNNSLAEKMDYLNSIALENLSSLKIYEVDIQQIIKKGISTMRPKIRRTFIMSRYEGLKNKEIAAIEGVAESTIEARITSALLVMKKLLIDYLQ